MSTTPTSKDEARAPYLSLTTLLNFCEKLGGGAIPPKVDKGYLDNYSGGVQAILLVTLRTLRWVDEDDNTLDALRAAAASEDERKRLLTEWATDFYAEQLKLAKENGTSKMLEDSFDKWNYSGSTKRKAIVFFLGLADYLGLPKSPFFKAPRQSPGGGTKRKRRDPGKSTVSTTTTTTPAPQGEAKTIDLGEAGTVTIAVDIRWLELPDDTFAKLRQIVRDLEALGEVVSPEPDDEDVEDEDEVDSS